MKLFPLSLISLLLLMACETSDFVYYEYEEILITRRIQGVINYFYYGYCDNLTTNCPKNHIRIYNRGLNSGMGAHLIFDNNKKVAFVRIYGGFELDNKPNNFYIEDFGPRSERYQWREEIKGNFNNVMYVSHLLDNEREINKKNNSKVKAIYPNF